MDEQNQEIDKENDKNNDNNSETGSIKSKDFNLAFLEYDSDEDYDEAKMEDPAENNQPNQNPTTNNNDEDLSDDENNNGNKSDNITMSCSYCGLTNASHLAQCKECKKWFCNGSLDAYSPSHIIFHLTKSKHKEVYLNENSQVGQMDLQCYNCGGKNIFLLGFLESREGRNGFILCREPCLTKWKIDD